jgi:ribosomal protein S18 acetylase RimI-like enzyme
VNGLKIRPYQDNDSRAVCQMFEDFIDYLATLDPMGRVVKQAEYGKNYLDKTLKDLKNKDGVFLVAEVDEKIVGTGVAVIETLSPEDLMEVLPHKPGRVSELFVSSQYRRQGIGTTLMQHLETYLKQKGCNTIHIEVFAPNHLSHKLYERLGFSDRNIDLIKLL